MLHAEYIIVSDVDVNSDIQRKEPDDNNMWDEKSLQLHYKIISTGKLRNSADIKIQQQCTYVWINVEIVHFDN